MVRRVLPLLCLLFLSLAATAHAQGFPIVGGFHSVLAFGEGESTSVKDLAA